MITTVTGKNQVTIPAKLAKELGIKPGNRLDWQHSKEKDMVRVKILRARQAMVMSLMGAGKKFLKKGEDPIAELVKQRKEEDKKRQNSL